MQQRWTVPVVALVAGPGFGKTVLLRQAIAEGSLAPSGIDVWHVCTPADADASALGEALADFLRAVVPGAGMVDPSAEGIVTAMARSDVPVGLLLDDVQQMPRGSSGAALLEQVIAGLPAHGHVVIATRSNGPIPLARLAATGTVHVLGEADLRFSVEEVAELSARAERSSAEASHLGAWPALVALTLDGHPELVERYLDEEVVGPLAPAERATLVTVVGLGGADDPLLAEISPGAVALSALASRVPRVEPDGDWFTAGAPWPSLASIRLDPAALRELRSRAIVALAERNEHDRAIQLAFANGEWPATAALLLDACAAGHYRHGPERIAEWLERIPPEHRGEPIAALLDGLRVKVSGAAAEVVDGRLADAITGFRSRGEVDGEMTALATLGHAIWTRQDYAGLAALFPRVLELEAAGSARAAAFAGLARAAMANAMGDDLAVLDHLQTVDGHLLGDDWVAVGEWFQSGALLMLGRPDEALPHARRAAARAGPGFAAARSVVPVVLWCSGRLDDLLAQNFEGSTAAIAVLDDPMTRRDEVISRAFRRFGKSLFGVDVDPADAGPPITDASDVVQAATVAGADVLVAIAAGDEAVAAERLEVLVASSDFTLVALERALRLFVGWCYVVAPVALRAQWDATDLGPSHVLRRQLARRFRAQRAEGPTALDPDDRWPGPGPCVAALGDRWSTELAVAGLAVGHPDARPLLDALGELLGERTRRCLHDLADHAHPDARRAATRYLAERPFPPRLPVDVRVLGPLELRRGGALVDEAPWRRERVRSLFLYLLEHGSASREQLADQLWPGLDERSAANNLRVTLSYLLGVLEPDRAAGDASWFVRSEGNLLRLVGDSHLTVDRRTFEMHLDRAAASAQDGAHSLELEALEVALGLWRGEPFVELPFEEWAELARVRLRQRYVEAALRAAELHAASGDRHATVRCARAALAIEPWSEQAYRMLIASSLAAGDRATAIRLLEECRRMLADLGLAPTPETLEVADGLA